MLNYDTMPNNLGDSIKRYIEKRIEPGRFLHAVLRNDLQKSFGYADSTNRYLLFEIVQWLYNEMPGETWGSKETVANYLREK